MSVAIALATLPRLKTALDLLGLDNGADIIAGAIIPAEWADRARRAEIELASLRLAEIDDLVAGEQSAQREIAKRAPAADEIINAAFDAGELASAFFDAWQNIYEARDAERRISRKLRKPI